MGKDLRNLEGTRLHFASLTFNFHFFIGKYNQPYLKVRHDDVTLINPQSQVEHLLFKKFVFRRSNIGGAIQKHATVLCHFGCCDALFGIPGDVCKFSIWKPTPEGSDFHHDARSSSSSSSSSGCSSTGSGCSSTGSVFSLSRSRSLCDRTSPVSHSSPMAGYISSILVTFV